MGGARSIEVYAEGNLCALGAAGRGEVLACLIPFSEKIGDAPTFTAAFDNTGD